MEWLTNHALEIVGVIGAAHLLAVGIVNLTPTPKDNEWLARVYPWIERLAGVLTSLAKEPNKNQEPKV